MALRTKLILWYSGLLAVIVIIFGIAVYGVVRSALISTIDHTLDNAIVQVRNNSRASAIGQFGPPRQVTVELPPLDAFALSGVLVQVWNLSIDAPSLIDASVGIDSYQQPLDPIALRGIWLNAGGDSVYTTIMKNNYEWRVLTQELNIWGLRIALQVAASSQPIKEATGVLVIIMLVAGGIGIIGSIIVGWWLAGRAVQPINKITEAAARIAATDDLKTRLSWTGPMDELGRLASVFNRMMARLEHVFSVQQRFVADVSHELRTPLTAIRGNLDLIKRYGLDPESLEAVESEVDRMARMVSDLLLLARADYGGLTLELEPLDLDTVVTEVYREARILAKDRDLKIAVGDFEPVRLRGNTDRIKQLMLNLIGNALKFTPDGGQITINLRREGYDAILEIQDTGIGISKEDQARIFDRFFQADASRVRKSTGEGAGLGLSIARWIVDAHHGKISVESELGKGTKFIIRLPVLSEPVPVSHEAVTLSRIPIIRRNKSTAPRQPEKTK